MSFPCQQFLAEVFSMRTRRTFVLLAANAFVCAFLAYGQDSQSLGDVARQARVQKQQKDAQAKDTPAKDVQRKDAQGSGAVSKDAQPPKPARVITNDEIPSHMGSTMAAAPGPQAPNPRFPQAALGNQKISRRAMAVLDSESEER